MGLQDTASKTALLLECTWPFEESTRITQEPPSEAMRYGSAFHKIFEQRFRQQHRDYVGVAAQYGVDPAALQNHTMIAYNYLLAWLEGDNVWDETFPHIRVIEQPCAASLTAHPSAYLCTPRPCEFEEETHTYDLLPGEFGGTPDLVVQSDGGMRVVIDYKTGDWGTYHSPANNPQLLSLALMTDADAVAILHTPRDGVPVMYAEATSYKDKIAFAKRRAEAMSRIGGGFLRPGPHCTDCPAREGCPTRAEEILVRSASLVRTATNGGAMLPAVDVGTLHLLLQRLDTLRDTARHEMRELVRRGEIIARPDGKILVLKEKKYETLSKASIIRALGKSAGEALITELREKGCIEEGVREELWAVNDK